MTDSDELLTIDEVADILRIGRTLAYELIAGGALPSVKINRCRRVRRSDLNAYIARLETVEVARA